MLIGDPSKDKGKDGNDSALSNMGSGAGPAWLLPDSSRAVKPIIWREREKSEFTSLTVADNPHVFMNDEYTFDVRARVNAGLGL